MYKLDKVIASSPPPRLRAIKILIAYYEALPDFFVFGDLSGDPHA